MSEIVLVRRGGGLFPTDDYSSDTMMACQAGKSIFVKLQQARNPKQHALLMTVIHKVAQNEGITTERLLRDIKIKLGMYDPIVKQLTNRRTGEVTEEVFYVMQSISFASMPQQNFKGVFDRFLDVIASEYLIPRDALLAEVLGIAA